MDISNLDPSLAALLEDVPVDLPSSTAVFDDLGDDFPDILNDIQLPNTQDDLFGAAEPNAAKVDLSVKSFPKITSFYNDAAHHYFDSTDFYKRVLKNCGNESRELHGLFTKYLTAADQKDKGVYRQRLLTIYWQFMSVLVMKLPSDEAAVEKKYALRYGLLLPTLLDADQKDIFAKIIDENTYNESVYYIDEWLQAIRNGHITPSSTDEVQTSGKNTFAHLEQMCQKAQGKLQNSENMLRAKSQQQTQAEEAIRNRIANTFVHDAVEDFSGIKAPFTDVQRRELNGIAEDLRKLIAIDRELSSFLYIRQMAKMTCGRQGNQFPVLSREFFRCNENEIGIRENVLSIMAWIESVDIQAYCRHYRSQLNRIPPFVILIPSYGDIGFCWEPFDRYNRITSRGRIVIPMYTKNLRRALLAATADLRWQVAKEKASYHWMDEGLTGHYYQWFQAQKLKGDVKDYFVNDYSLWIMKESDGIQKLDKEVRNVFWRYMPFSQNIKDDLKTRAPVYQELYQKDINRQMSDGY